MVNKVVEETQDYKIEIVSMYIKSINTNDSLEKIIKYTVFFASYDFNPYTNRWMRTGNWSPSTAEFKTIEEARNYALNTINN